MTRRPTDAERVDAAVSAVLDDRAALLPPALAGELAVAHALHERLPLVPPGATFEGELARRLEGDRGIAVARRVHGFLHDHQRLVLTGAVGSVLLSTASAAVLAWRLVHR